MSENAAGKDPKPNRKTEDIFTHSTETNLIRQFQLRLPGEASAAYASTGERTVVGTHPSADFVLQDPTVSRFHCELKIETQEVVVRDLSSRNGTLVMLWIAAAKWQRARLSSADSEALADVLGAAVLEGRFGEAARLLERNKERLPLSSRRVCRAVFDPALIAPMFGSGSFIHLALLADSTVLENSECDRFQIVDTVVRELARCERSPLRSAVIDTFGGQEFHEHPPGDAALIDATFKNPGWYRKTIAHYSLLIPAIERLNSGEFDADYNGNGRHYEAQQGISTRSRCILYLALKTHVLALREAVNAGISDDFYVTDIFDLFRVVRQRSHFDAAVWESDLTNYEHPTPFAVLLYEILHDLEDLFCQALPLEGRLPHDIGLTWSFCVWDLAKSWENVSERFRLWESANYLTFVLQLAYAPHEACIRKLPDPSVTKAKADLLVEQLNRRCLGTVLPPIMEKLDSGKRYVQDGYEWLAAELGVRHGE